MVSSMQENQLLNLGLDVEIANKIKIILQTYTPEKAWKYISNKILTPAHSFNLHLLLFSLCYPDWRESPNTAAAWIPDVEAIQRTHLAAFMRELTISTRAEFHTWSINHWPEFWKTMLAKLNIQFAEPPITLCDLSQGIECPHWLSGAKLNIIDSCFKANPNKIAIIQQKRHGPLQQFTFAEVARLTNRVANSLVKQGFQPGDNIAIDMPMHIYAVAIYLGIIKMGGVVISIADSFSKDEIAARLRITQAKGIFTQDTILRDNKKISLYEKVVAACSPLAIVLPCENELSISLRANDISWQDFLIKDEHFQSYIDAPDTACNILFSSGTTGDPKAIPWTHTTPIKVASDAYLHLDINSTDILAWPTNLGWMMGPWLIFAAFINDAAIALYEDAPRDRDFGLFIQNARVTMLGVVPTLVATWRQTNCMQNLDWQQLKCYSSTGECSNPEDMLYLMSLAGYKPIIEYCGGTEIGGAYISSTLIENNYPAVFTTATMGLNFLIIDEQGQPAETGEVALIPPSIGLSNELLNADHHSIYFANMPALTDGRALRRHGDQIHQFPEGGYCVLGRVDDTMNLGGIKISSAEIERVIAGIDNIIETAAIAVNLYQQGPSHLVIYAATQIALDKEKIKKMMQIKINQHLNPLFKIYDLVFVSELPKTASNKIMRRVLRKEYSTAAK
jgi:acetyl-CoA synthetase